MLPILMAQQNKLWPELLRESRRRYYCSIAIPTLPHEKPMTLKHSYSGIKDYEGCQRRYHAVRILRKFKQEDTVATLYGKQAHEAFELYIKEGGALDPRFAQFEKFVAPLRALPGEKLCEYEMGLTAGLAPCAFDAKDVWIRGIADLIVLNREKGVARVVDYKTGKSSRYADTAQLELMAAMTMIHFPEIDRVKAALLFVVAGDIVKAEYERKDLSEILSRWVAKTDAIERSVMLDVWNAQPSGLCKFCPMPPGDCEHR